MGHEKSQQPYQMHTESNSVRRKQKWRSSLQQDIAPRMLQGNLPV